MYIRNIIASQFLILSDIKNIVGTGKQVSIL